MFHNETTILVAVLKISWDDLKQEFGHGRVDPHQYCDVSHGSIQVFPSDIGKFAVSLFFDSDSGYSWGANIVVDSSLMATPKQTSFEFGEGTI